VDILAWDLPGHGDSPSATEAFSVADLADAVVALVDSTAEGASFHYAGVSLGGATGLQLGLRHGDRLRSLSVQCTGAKLGTAESWSERAQLVRDQGTTVLVEGSIQRWFAPGFMEREPEVAEALLDALRSADPASYAFCCDALAGHDVLSDLGSVRVRTQALAGVEDTVAPPPFAEAIADGIRAGGGTAEAVALDGVAHLAPAEAPGVVAGIMRAFIAGDERTDNSHH
jgi:3-oxoadipate enol-lactonase